MRSLVAIVIGLLVVGVVCQDDPAPPTTPPTDPALLERLQGLADSDSRQTTELQAAIKVLEEVRNRLDESVGRLEAESTKLDDVQARTDRLESKVSNQQRELLVLATAPSGNIESQVSNQQQKLEQLENTLQQQASTGTQLSQALDDIQRSVGDLQNKLKEQEQAHRQEQVARASAATDDRLVKIESDLAAVKTLLSEVTAAVTKDQERLASLTASLASNHGQTQAQMASLIQSIEKLNSSSQSTGEAIYTWFTQNAQPYTKELFATAGQKASAALDSAVKWGNKQDPKLIYKMAVDEGLKLWKNANVATEKFLVNSGVSGEHAPLAAKIAVGAAGFSSSLVTLLLLRVLLSLFFRVLFFPCRACCGSSSSKKSLTSTQDVPADSTKDTSKANKKATSGPRPPAQRQ